MSPAPIGRGCARGWSPRPADLGTLSRDTRLVSVSNSDFSSPLPSQHTLPPALPEEVEGHRREASTAADRERGACAAWPRSETVLGPFP